MTDEERDRAFRKERARQARRMTAIQIDTLGEITRLLDLTRERIDKVLKGQPTDWQLWSLPRLRLQVVQQLEAMAGKGEAALHAGAETSWEAGQELLEKPLAAAGFDIAPHLPTIDRDQLVSMKSMLTTKIKGIGIDTANRINQELGLVVTGLNTPGQATTAIARLLKVGGRRRALTIVRTELGTAFSAAHQARQEQAVELLPGLEKQWRRSGKAHSRVEHDAADGQIQPVKEPFNVAGNLLMYPRDPAAPVGQRVNCGCDSLPVMARWKVSTAGRRIFTAEEVDANPRKRDLAAITRQTEFPPRAKPGLAGPGSDQVRREQIRRLEATDPKVAIARVSALVQDDAFRAFVSGGDPGDYPVGILPDALKAPIGASGQVVRLSRQTIGTHAAKEETYRLLQAMLDRGEVRRDRHSARHLRIIHQRHVAVVKATEDGRELFLQSLHRTNPHQVRRYRKQGPLIRGGEE